jgi:hypothetical protein
MRNRPFSAVDAREVCWTQEQRLPPTLSRVNWKAIAFWVLLWWLVYSAPTEQSFDQMFFAADTSSAADSF